MSVYTRILFVFEYIVDGISRKLFTAIENTSFGKRFYYVFNVNALRVLVVNKPYDFGFFFVKLNHSPAGESSSFPTPIGRPKTG